MARIEAVSDAAATPDQEAALKLVTRAWGQPWNITRAMAHNPAILEGFMALHGTLGRAGLSKQDREVICMEMARHNGCHYCVPAHRCATDQAGVDKVLIERIARGETLEGNERPAVLQRLVRRLLETGGKLGNEEFDSYQAAGFDHGQMIAVVADIAHCTLTNMFNRLAQTELDDFLEPYQSPFT